MYRPPEIEAIRTSVRQFTDRKIKNRQFDRVFDGAPVLLKTKKANEWMKQEYGKPALKTLFGGFWAEGELCILFADTNLGKSILAVQIGDSLTKEYSIGPFDNHVVPGAKVLYLDFELGSKQFESRYVHAQWGSYLFSDNFYRSEFDSAAIADDIYYKNYNDHVNQALDAAICKLKPQVLIIDNITYMRSGTSNATDALDLMKSLKALKNKYKLSILVLAHTPKRSNTRPITVNDLQGSKMLINFADSAFAIGQSHTKPGLRYLKQIKQRNNREQYGAGNVCLISLETNLNFLQYKFEGYAHERDHLQQHPTYNREELVQQVLQLHQSGGSLRKIAKEVGVHFTTVDKILRENKSIFDSGAVKTQPQVEHNS
jgi:hypothetical protein